MLYLETQIKKNNVQNIPELHVLSDVIVNTLNFSEIAIFQTGLTHLFQKMIGNLS